MQVEGTFRLKYNLFYKDHIWEGGLEVDILDIFLALDPWQKVTHVQKQEKEWTPAKNRRLNAP